MLVFLCSSSLISCFAVIDRNTKKTEQLLREEITQLQGHLDQSRHECERLGGELAKKVVSLDDK